MGRAPGPLPDGVRSQALERNGGLGRPGRPPARPLAAPHGALDCALRPGCSVRVLERPLGGARDAHPGQSRKSKARGSRWDRSDRRRRAWLGVLHADRALLGGEEPAPGSQPYGSC